MSLGNFLERILPTFEGNALKDNLSKNIKALNLELLPQYINLKEVKGNSPFKSKFAEDFEYMIEQQFKVYMIGIKNIRNPDILDYMISAIKNISSLGSFLDKQIDTDIGDKIVTSTISFNKQTLLKLLDMIDFFTTYSSVLINVISHEELMAVADSQIKTHGIGPKDIPYLKANLTTFTVAMTVLTMSVKDLKAEYCDILDATVSEETYQDMLKVFGIEKIDPLGLSSVPFPLSIIFYARLNIAAKQMDAYDEVVETAKATELRILLYRKQLAESKGDANLEKLLEATEKRLTNLKYERDKLEKKYGLQ